MRDARFETRALKRRIISFDCLKAMKNLKMAKKMINPEKQIFLTGTRRTWRLQKLYLRTDDSHFRYLLGKVRSRIGKIGFFSLRRDSDSRVDASCFDIKQHALQLKCR